MISLDALAQRAGLAPLDLNFARTAARLAGEDDAAAILGAALASRFTREGHTCVDLRALAGQPMEQPEGAEPLSWPELEGWAATLRASPMVETAPASGTGQRVHAPLVIDSGDRLYLARYWLYQERLADQLRQRAMVDDTRLDPAGVAGRLDRLFAEEDREQRRAAEVAVQGDLAVISGGPGTGKTSTVVKILALLLDLSADPISVLLLAPTGKAAARLTESIRAAKAGRVASLDPALLEAIPEEASTIHRALGWRPDRPTRPSRDRDFPLAADVVVVDEASMVDLALMTRLAEAVRPGARLILLGDRDQLASVEAGAVLASICDAEPGASVVHLRRNYRFGPDSGIARLASAINAGDGAGAVQLLQQKSPDLRWLELSTPSALKRALRPLVCEGYGPYLSCSGAADQLRALAGFRLLCAHRRGAFGVTSINPLVEAVLARELGLRTRSTWYPGRPLLIGRNDYQLRLFNGDVGVVHRDTDGEPRASFPASDGTLRTFAPSRLPPHETVFAMTVHKSQGSEFDQVVVVLPPARSPVVTRELLYTAVTRARDRVTIVGTADVIREAVETPVRRSSGLRDRLSPTAASSAER